MCYSAEVWADYDNYIAEFGTNISIRQFFHVFYRKARGDKLKIPKAMEAAFAHPRTDEEHEIKAVIDEYHKNESTRLEQDLFSQRKRLADAERKLKTKTTKAATESVRIATSKIKNNMRWLDDLKRTELKQRDYRIYPDYYCPVMIMENGKLVVKPMRYHCLPVGKPAFYDTKFPGTFNARRDSLEGYWKGVFGYTHGVIATNAFYENVSRHRAEGRELGPSEEPENVILEFKPRHTQVMWLACLWSHWKGKDDDGDLLSFAIITDEPPPEVAATGHDRCPIPLKRGNIETWLNPDPTDLAAQYAILDDRERPYYEHRLAA